jgi:charged multivesicular body protein 4
MDEIREQMEHTKEIADAISNPVNVGVDVDEVTIFHNRIPFDDTECRNRIL